MHTFAEYVIASLKGSGVRRLYGLPGDSLNGLTDAIRRDDDVDWVHVRHEESAALAAAAEAGLTGELAVCVGSCGPGNLHLINGLFDAQRSRVPVLAIAAQIPGSEIGSGYFQETRPQELFADCSVYAEVVTSPEHGPRILRTAMRAAVERRGAAVVVVPGEIFLGKIPRDPAPAVVRPTHSVLRPHDEALREAAALLNEAKRVTILAGAGAAGAHDDLVRLAETLKAPVVHALRGKEYVEYDNPYDVGMTGLLGFASGYKAIEEADTLLMLGTDFPYRQFYPRGAKVVQLDLRGEQIGRRTHVDLPLVGSVRDTLPALLPLLTVKSGRGHLDDALAHYARTRKSLDSLAVNDHERTPIHPQFVASTIDRLAADDAVFTVDVGSPVVWAARYLTFNGRRRLLGSFNHGTMANALPHAVGAQAAHPGRQVVSLSGDGGLTMLLGELFTLRQNRLPAKIVVFNNGSLNFVELEMKAAGIVNYATELDNPQLAEVAAAVGLWSRRVERPGDLEDALKGAFTHDGPALVEVMTARQELSVPPAVTVEQAKGFTLYAIRTILSGRGEELLDLVTTNVSRRILH
ncbi:ubiquinone-dependent pyruvate dehydrogenase [Streptomyces sp. VRA16 Mangrove soil]|uniref:ubiquinone-dependent pyruvate dehydrogenase n=1 Tax=Streptomyces sp. VRA16 Mangrove soil TaxID=2817434 RepID=UPI001A9F40CB|nr:ubiquinone-dependent pyruvate dehydrogenase [Streptomyces sp. VRA16 Mangrove soil]MBO1329866.1 ubiquinone-dependent pyruvate dehydrogenase [Streptomyces sp. VRA16 Mangrove soil]